MQGLNPGGGEIDQNNPSTTIAGQPDNLYFETFTHYIALATVETLKAFQTLSTLFYPVESQVLGLIPPYNLISTGERIPITEIW